MPRVLMSISLVCWCLVSSPASADLVSLNFVGNAGAAGTLSSSSLAGNSSVAESFAGNWNNLSGASATNVGLVDGNGGATSILVSYNSPLGVWSIPNTSLGTNVAGGANPTMMRGYLDADNRGATVTISNLSTFFTEYRVLIYFDGDNGTSWRAGQYVIRDPSSTVLFSDAGEDSEGVNFNSGSGNNANGQFQVPAPGGAGNIDWTNSLNNDEGNFLMSGLLTSGTFTLTATGIAGTGLRAPINGIQIIGNAVPEPGTIALVALAAPLALGWWVRKRRASCPSV